MTSSQSDSECQKEAPKTSDDGIPAEDIGPTDSGGHLGRGEDGEEADLSTSSKRRRSSRRAHEELSKRQQEQLQLTLKRFDRAQFQRIVSMPALERISMQLPKVQLPPPGALDELIRTATASGGLQESLNRSFAAMFDSSIERILDNFREYARRISQTVEQVIPELASGLKVMAEHGWYLDDEMPIDYILDSPHMENGGVHEIDEILSEHFRMRLSGIQTEITRAYPARRDLFRVAFGAHLNELYELSIPILLAQADGVFTEALGGSPFRTRQRKNARIKLIQTSRTKWDQEVLLSALWAQAAVWMTESERGSGFSGLNRHQVVHGEVLDYGTEVNSLKAVSLLNYFVMLGGTIDSDRREDDMDTP